MHFGSLVAALASYADARAHGGRWLVRIEDVDEPRAQPDAYDAIVAALARHGFAWDGPVVRQSERTAHYAAALAQLEERDLAYPCACSRRDLQSAPVGTAGDHIYPGTCRDGIAASRNARSARSWRVRVGDAVIGFTDRLQGPQEQDLGRDVGDFVIRRADGLFAYQLAVVVDDAAQAISDVVRGADLLASTPRQIHLQRVLALPVPTYLHVPVALDRAGLKMSKQAHAAALPDTPLRSLVAAWSFLEQPAPDSAPRTVAEFWAFAARAWKPQRAPPVAMLPAPAGV
ncbi:MAG: tRNA glutamyl-Q(34) synthetase GluQRS [Betaproteobacteria bacterium]